MREQSGLTFPLLMDPDLATIKAYGILNIESGKIPHPTAVIVDKSGSVTYVRMDEQFIVRPSTVEELLPALASAD
jgi:peroxiredoxin